MASRYCLNCQTPFGDGTGKAKYCSARCRMAAFKARQDSGAGPAAKRAPVVTVSDVAATTTHEGPLQQAVLAEIGETAARTVVGTNAILIARQLDSGEERGTAVAALSRQLQILVQEAKRGPGATADLIDDLAARREKRLGA